MIPLERAARALANFDGIPCAEERLDCPGGVSCPAIAKQAARAVIEAIREPSAQMIDAMYDEYQGGGKGSLRDCWFEAIDALLEEGA